MVQLISDDIHSLLDQISAVPTRTASFFSPNFVQKTLSQCHMHKQATRMLETGDVNPETGEVNCNAPPLVLPLNWHIEYVFLQGESVRMATYFVASKHTQVKQLCESLISSFLSGHLLIALMIARALIEHIAIFSDTVDSLEPREGSMDLEFQSVQKMQQRITNFLTQRCYPTKINWKDIENAFGKSPTQKAPSYSAGPLIVDKTAPQILNLIDRLSRKVDSSRLTYDVLSEFVHPNAGGIMAVVNNSSKQLDENGIEWILTEFQSDQPTAFLLESDELLVHLLGVLLNCLKYFEAGIKQFFVHDRNRLLLQTKVLVQNVLSETVDDGTGSHDLRKRISPYADCPCGSETKFKFCCRVKAA